MTLAVERIAMRWRIPRHLAAKCSSAKGTSRAQLASALSRKLSPVWAVRPEVVRIHRLKIRCKISAAQIGGDAAAEIVAEAIARELARALTRPADASAVEIVRAESRPEWLARFIADRLAGTATGRWEYAEFETLCDLRTGQAILSVLLREPAEALAVLQALLRRDALERVLSLLDELALEQLFVALAGTSPDAGRTLAIADLAKVGRLLAHSRFRPSAGFASRRHALQLFLGSSDQLEQQSGWSPRRVLHALIALEMILEGGWPPAARDDIARWAARLSLRSRSHHPAVMGMIEAVGALQSSDRAGGGQNDPDLVRLAVTLAELATNVQPRLTAFAPTRWIASDYAGLLLLTGTVVRLGWLNTFMSLPLAESYGPRLANYLLAGVVLAVLNEGRECPDRLDPAAAVFSGWVDTPDLVGFRGFLVKEPVESRLVVLAAIEASRKRCADAAREWATTFDFCAELALRSFASRIRGFRQAPRSFVVRQLLALPGRIIVEEQRLRVVLEPHAYLVALRLAGADEPLAAVSWLGGRRLEFDLQGL
jgi:hypothetical protein